MLLAQCPNGLTGSNPVPSAKMRYESIGVCWWQGLCNWWVPPLEARLSPNGMNYCIKCWEWKYEENPTKRIEKAKNANKNI